MQAHVSGFELAAAGFGGLQASYAQRFKDIQGFPAWKCCVNTTGPSDLRKIERTIKQEIPIREHVVALAECHATQEGNMQMRLQTSAEIEEGFPKPSSRNGSRLHDAVTDFSQLRTPR